MKKFALPLMVCAVLGLTGCGDYVTPQGVVFTAAVAVKTNDMGAYKKAFGGKALAEFGTSAGMTAFGSKLSTMVGFKVETAKLVTVKPVHNNGFQTAVKTYTVGIDAKASKDAAMARILTATVDCDIYTVTNDTCEVSESTTSECRTAQPGYFPTEDFTECKIVELQ